MSPIIRIPEALLQPDSLVGALLYAVLLLLIASLGARALRGTVNRVLARDAHGHIDRTVASFLTQLAQIAIFIVAFTVYAHIIPEHFLKYRRDESEAAARARHRRRAQRRATAKLSAEAVPSATDGPSSAR